MAMRLAMRSGSISTHRMTALAIRAGKRLRAAHAAEPCGQDEAAA